MEGRHFVVFPDHQALVGALARASETKSDRQRRQLSFISEFTADIWHIAGQANVVADTLIHCRLTPVSSLPPSSQLPLDIRLISVVQASCPYSQQALQSTVLKVVQVAFEGQPVLVNISSGGNAAVGASPISLGGVCRRSQPSSPRHMGHQEAPFKL
jgi:hypothetical protein